MSITTDNSTSQIVGSVENIDPKVLQFEDNVRDQVDLERTSWPACGNTG